MSDSSDGPPSSSSARARTRIRRSSKACDECRRRKVKCEESSIADTCSNCLSLGIKCTHLAQKRGPKPRLYQQQRSNDAKFLISTILSAPKSVIVPNDESLIREMLVNLATYARDLEKQLDKIPEDHPAPPLSPIIRKPVSSTSQDPDDVEESLTIKVQSLSLDDEFYHRHVGKSSHFMLLQTALNIRNEVNSEAGGGTGTMLLGTRRTEFWTPSPWHRFLAEPNDPPYVFPEPDLLRDLLTLYFEKQHIIFPVLHQQTFERQVYIDQLHLSDRRFGAVVLAVCALGSRLTNDPRTFSDGTQDLRSAGWRYIEQIRFFKSHFTPASSLYDAQLSSLALIFLFPTPAPELGWFLVVMGIRVAQECGAHRKGNLTKNPAQTRLEQALWRRAFWSLASTDLYMSTASGRPRSTREDDFDLELPPECDDMYWEIPSNPKLEFTQPAGKPSHMAYWHHFIKLLRIAGLVKDHLFTTRKAAPWLRDSPDNTKKIVMELDSMLNKWKEEVPNYLRWDPDCPDDIIFAQTVMMYSNYHWVEIQIHKIFVRPGSLLTENFPSLAICTHSARAYIHILEVYNARDGMPLLPNYIAPTFVAATMLLINLWTNMRGKTSYDPKKDMADVHTCMKHLAKYETRYEAAGRAYDILDAVVSLSPIPPFPEIESRKRTRNPDTFKPDLMESDSTTRKFAGSKRVLNTMNPVFSGFNEPISINHDVLNPFAFDVINTKQHYSLSVEDPDSISYLDYYEPTVEPSAWSDSSNEEWSSFMSRVDELLGYMNPDAL